MNTALFGNSSAGETMERPPASASPLASVNPSSAKAAATDRPTLYVLDTTATAQHPARQHEVWDGQRAHPYNFQHNQYLAMPYEHGVKLVKIPEFIVRTDSPDGPRLQPQGDPDGRTAARDGIKLGDTELVARYDELTEKALALRCNQLAGGERLTMGDGKVRLIRFLIESRQRAQAEAIAALKRRRPDHLAPGPGDLGDDQVDSDTDGQDTPELTDFFRKIAEEARSQVG